MEEKKKKKKDRILLLVRNIIILALDFVINLTWSHEPEWGLCIMQPNFTFFIFLFLLCIRQIIMCFYLVPKETLISLINRDLVC